MCLSNEVLTAAYQGFLDELTGAGLLIPSGVPGVYGHSGVFERVLEGFDQCVTRRSAHLNAEVIRFPGVLNRQHYLKTSHIESFPDLMGSIHSFTGNEREHLSLLQKRTDGADWTQDLKPTFSTKRRLSRRSNSTWRGGVSATSTGRAITNCTATTSSTSSTCMA